MTEHRRDTDEPRFVSDETREALPIPEAAERLGLSIDAIRMRIRRSTVQTVEIDGKKHVLVPRLDTDATQCDSDETTTEPPHTRDEIIDGLRSEVAYLRQTLDAEIEARRRADHLVAGLIDERRDLMRQLEAGSEHRFVGDATPTTQDAAVVPEREPTAHERREAFWHASAGPPTTLRAWIRRLLGRWPRSRRVPG